MQYVLDRPDGNDIYISCSTNVNLLTAYGTDSINVKCGYNLMRNASYEWNANAYHFRCGYWRYLRLICDLFHNLATAHFVNRNNNNNKTPATVHAITDDFDGTDVVTIIRLDEKI